MDKLLHTVCIVFSFISLGFICVDEELIPGFIPCYNGINPKGINGVMSVVGGSFIAGYIFYLLTFTIPNYFRTKRTNIQLLNHLNYLKQWVSVCGEPFGELQSIIKDENPNDLCYPHQDIYEKIKEQIQQVEEHSKPLIMESLHPIYRYFTYLTPEQQREVERIERSNVFIWSKHLLEKTQISIGEVQLFIRTYDSLKNSTDKLVKSVE